MKAWWTIFKVGLLLPCLAVATDGEEFWLVLDVNQELCMASWCTDCPVSGWHCDPTDRSQRWYMRGSAIVNSESGQCLDAGFSWRLETRKCHGKRSQEWEFDYLRDHLLGEMHLVRYFNNRKCMKFLGTVHSGRVLWASLSVEECAYVTDERKQFLKLTEWPYSWNKTKDVASNSMDRKCPECPMCSNSSHQDCPKCSNSTCSNSIHQKCPECPACSKCSECPTCSKCPECPACLNSTCPSSIHQKCPEFPTYSKCPECPPYSKCPDCPTCSNSTCSNSIHVDCRCPECVQSQSHLWFIEAGLLGICTCWIWKGSKGDKQVPSTSPHGQARENKPDTMEATSLQIETALTEKLEAMEAAILHIESLTEVAAPAQKKQLDNIESALTEQAPKKKPDTMEATILHDIYSTVTEIAAAIDGQRGSDSSSECTVGSWTHVTSGQPCCFLQDAYFKVVTDDGEICEKPAKMLFKGTRVIAANGTVIEVLNPPEQHQVDAVIKLQVGSAFLVVSPDHRILIPGKKTIQAKELEEGSEVFLDGTESKAKLTSVEWNLEPTMVVKIAFKPDIPVAAFMWSPSILSKGSRNKPPLRRGNSTRTPTIPDTEPPLTP